MTAPSDLNEMYVVGPQDPNEPIWATDYDIASMQNVDDPNDQFGDGTKVPGIRTNTGSIGFLNALEEVADAFLENDQPLPVKKDKLDPIRTRELGSDKWGGRRATVTQQMAYPLVVNSPCRRRITIINYGPSIMLIDSLQVNNAVSGVRVPVSGAAFWAPVELTTRDDVWAIGATGNCDVDIIEEYDLDD